MLLMACSRSAYEKVIKELDIRPLKVQAGRNVIIKLQEGAEPEKVHQTDANADVE
jgi:hypothetical protein